jgi:hypothetical protein
MKKSFAIFAAVSMTAAGVTLASNVTLSKRAGELVADLFEFVGPVSGLIGALVKPNDPPAQKIIVSFEPESPVSGSLPLANNRVRSPKGASPFELPLWQSMASANTALFSDPTKTADAVRKPSGSATESVQVLAEGPSVSPITIATGNAPGSASENAERLALLDTVLKSVAAGGPASLQKSDDVWAFMTSRPGAVDSGLGMLAMNGQRVSKEIVGEVAIPSMPANGFSGAANSPAGTAGSGGSPNGAAPATTPATTTTSTTGKVPLPGTLALLAVGLAGALLGARSRR